MSISRRFVDLVSEQFDAPEIALACLQPEIDALREKEQARKTSATRQPPAERQSQRTADLEPRASGRVQGKASRVHVRADA